MTIASNIASKVRSLNEQLAKVDVTDKHPAGLDNPMMIAKIIDHSSQIGELQRYQRYTYQHGMKFHVTIVKSAPRLLKPAYVMSLLIDDGGEIINPMFMTMSDQDSIDKYNFTLGFLDALFREVKYATAKQGVCSSSGI